MKPSTPAFRTNNAGANRNSGARQWVIAACPTVPTITSMGMVPAAKASIPAAPAMALPPAAAAARAA